MKQVFSLSIFLCLAVIAWWSITADYSDDDQTPSAYSGQFAEMFMKEFEMTAMNEDGKPGYIMNGSYLQRNTGSNDTMIQQPMFHLLQGNNQWKVIADQAIVNDKKETIQLKHNVVMQQLNSKPAITIRTQYLSIQTKTQIAQTHEQVKITKGGSEMTSEGMVFNNITSELELSSSVNGHYSPHD